MFQAALNGLTTPAAAKASVSEFVELSGERPQDSSGHHHRTTQDSAAIAQALPLSTGAFERSLD
jgi:hypothetical protein